MENNLSHDFDRDRRRFLLWAKIAFGGVWLLSCVVLIGLYYSMRDFAKVPMLVGHATVVECIHRSNISWMGIPGEGIPPFTFQQESWKLILRVGGQTDSLPVDRFTCETAPGTSLEVQYKYLPNTGRLVILGFK